MNVTNVSIVNDVNEAASGVALAEPARPVHPPIQALVPSALRDMSARMLRLYQEVLPGAPTAVDGEPRAVPDGEGPTERLATPAFAKLGEIAVNQGPISGILASTDGGHLAVTNHAANCVSVIDTSTFSVIATIGGTEEPFAIAGGGADDSHAYVSTVSADYDSISVIDTDTHAVVATHPVALSVQDLAVSPDGKRLYASRTGLDGTDVIVIDASADRVKAIDVATGEGVSAGTLCLSPDGRRLYVATVNSRGSDVVVIDTRKERVVATIEVGLPIRGVALSPDSRTAYIASCDPALGGVVDVIDTRTHRVTDTVKIGGSPTQLTISSGGKWAYVVSDDQITVLCTATKEVIDAIAVESGPSCVTESADGKQLFVADHAGGVTVLSLVAPTI